MRRRAMLQAGVVLATAPLGRAASAAPSDLTRVIARVGKNHGHVFTVAMTDVLAGADKTYDLTGTSPHAHAITLTAAHMKLLATGEILRVRSTEGNAHAHRLWVRCAPPVDPPEWVTACKATFTGKDEHEIVMPEADLASTTDKTYDVQGIAGHTHQLIVTATDFDILRKGFPVTRHTTRLPEDSHMHQVTIERIRKKS